MDMDVNIFQCRFVRIIYVAEAYIIEVDRAVRNTVERMCRVFKSLSSSRTSTIRFAELSAMMIITNTIESIIKLERIWVA